jgi:hypothetical protein
MTWPLARLHIGVRQIRYLHDDTRRTLQGRDPTSHPAWTAGMRHGNQANCDMAAYRLVYHVMPTCKVATSFRQWSSAIREVVKGGVPTGMKRAALPPSTDWLVATDRRQDGPCGTTMDKPANKKGISMNHHERRPPPISAAPNLGRCADMAHAAFLLARALIRCSPVSVRCPELARHSQFGLRRAGEIRKFPDFLGTGDSPGMPGAMSRTGKAT